MAKPEPSEWGKLNAGQSYQVVALDLFRALAHAGLNSYEQIVMQVVMERSWFTSARIRPAPGVWSEPVACVLGVTELAREVLGDAADKAEVDRLRKRLYEARHALAKSGILVEDGDGVWINKNADEWTLTDGRTPRLGPAALAYALAARSRRKGAKGDGHARNSGYAMPGIPDTPCPEFRACMPGKTDTHARNSGHGLIEEAPARSGRLKKREEDVPSAREQDARAGDGEPFDPGGADLPPEVRGPGKGDPDAKALARWATALGGDYSFWAYESTEVAPVAWVRLLLERKVVGNPRRPSIAVLSKILADWRAAGRPEFEASSADGAAPPRRNGRPAPLTPEERERKRAEFMAKLTGGE